jgi:hypothetical protein
MDGVSMANGKAPVKAQILGKAGVVDARREERYHTASW